MFVSCHCTVNLAGAALVTPAFVWLVTCHVRCYVTVLCIVGNRTQRETGPVHAEDFFLIRYDIWIFLSGFFFLVTADFAIFWLNFGKTSMFCRDGRQFWIQPRAGSMWKGFSEETRSAGTKLWLIQTTTSLVKLWKIITLHINRFPQPALSDQYNYYVQMKNCTFYTHYISNIMSINIGFNPGEHFLLHRRNFEAEIFAAGNSSKKKYL